MVTLSRLHDEARREWARATAASGTKLAGEGSRVGVLDSESAERAREKASVSGLVKLRAWAGRKTVRLGREGGGEVLARLAGEGAAAWATQGPMAWSWLRILGRRSGPWVRMGEAGGCGGSCAVAHERIGGRRLEGVDGAMRTGASVSRVVGDFEKRRIKGKARGGGRVAWWESKVE